MAPKIVFHSAITDPRPGPTYANGEICVTHQEPTGFAKWLMQPHVLKEWFDTANAHRPEASMPVGTRIIWNTPSCLSHADESHLRWARCKFEDFSQCLITEEPADPAVSGPRPDYMMELWLPQMSEEFSLLVWLEDRDASDFRDCEAIASRPVWSSYIHGNFRLADWWDDFPFLPEMGAMNALGALNCPTTPMINPTKYYWLRLRKFARARKIAMYWWGLTQATQCAPGGAGRLTDAAAWDEDPVFGSK